MKELHKERVFYRPRGARTKKLYWAWTDWLELDYSLFLEQREVLEIDEWLC